LELLAINFDQQPVRNVTVRAVDAALAVVEAEEVFGYRLRSQTGGLDLQSGHVRDPEGRSQGGVLAVGLSLTSHPRIARDVQDRRKSVADANCALLTSDDEADAVLEIGVPARTPSDTGRETRRAREVR